MISKDKGGSGMGVHAYSIMEYITIDYDGRKVISNE